MRKKSNTRLWTTALMILVAILAGFPFLWMVLSGFKSKDEILRMGQFFPSVWHWENYRTILVDTPIPRYIANSFFVASVTVALQLINGAMAAYAFVFLRFRLRKALFALILASYMLPSAATYIPAYILLADAHLLNTFTGLILSNAVSIFGIFLLRQAFLQIPKAVVEAARMDGASHFRILAEIVAPMAKPTLLTLALMNFITYYNNYMWPSLITDDERVMLVSQGLRKFFIEGGAYGTEWALVMAASAVVVLPLVALFAGAQRKFFDGIAGDAGIKG